MLRGRAVQVQRAVAARDEPGVREARERVRDRGPLGADEPAEQAVRERERERGCRPARRGPSGPARCQSRSVRRTSRRGCEVIARWTSRSAARVHARVSSAREICGQGLTRSANASSSSASRVGTSACQADSRSSRSSARAVEGLQDVAVADDLGRGAVADADVDGEHAVDHEHARPVADLGEAARRDRSRRPAPRTPPAVTTWRATRRMRRSSSAARSSSRSSR